MSSINQTITHEYAQKAWEAFQVYSQLPFTARRDFLHAIADELEADRAMLTQVCQSESNLPEARMNGELSRTIFQLKSYGDAAVRGEWLNASIDTADTERVPPKPDVRKTCVPLGPVLVFGASNFPFAYSTAGGDTASALAAGCPVIVKAHSAHTQTSTLVAAAIKRAIEKQGLPEGVFQHLVTNERAVVNEFITHQYIKAIGFTGSFGGGKAIWELANSRHEPIPVYAEMSSINPVYLFAGKLATDATALAPVMAGSMCLGAGQFCTNPGLIIAQDSPKLQEFVTALSEEIKKINPANMLHQGIADNFRENRETVLSQPNVEVLAVSATQSAPLQDIPTVAKTTAKEFLSNPKLGTEVFGTFSVIVVCETNEELVAVAQSMEGQLTSSLFATEEDLAENKSLINEIALHCGRLIFNQVPTGVEVCQAMNHGGPWPSTTDSKFSSVGSDAIKRFGRPLSYQNYPDALLPAELQNANPLGIFRTVNNVLTKDSL